jgi:hypothetical protein
MKSTDMIAAELGHGSGDAPVKSALFAIRNLSVLAYANGFTLWHYKGANTLSEIEGSNFFGESADMLSTGDIIMVSARDGARVMFVVKADANYVAVARV